MLNTSILLFTLRVVSYFSKIVDCERSAARETREMSSDAPMSARGLFLNTRALTDKGKRGRYSKSRCSALRYQVFTANVAVKDVI